LIVPVAVNDGSLPSWVNFDMPIGAGVWMPALDSPQPLIWRQGNGLGPLQDRLYLLRHIADHPLPLRVAQFIRQYHVRYVFYGAPVRPGATRHLNLTRLLADAHLRLIYTSAAGGRQADRVGMRCPSTGSYVFAIEDNGQPMDG
jgi:hypothetical protein